MFVVLPLSKIVSIGVEKSWKGLSDNINKLASSLFFPNTQTLFKSSLVLLRAMYVELDTGRISTTVASTEEHVNEAIETLMSNFSNYTKVIGLDTMMNRVADGTQRGITEILSLQLSDDKNCLIIPFYLFEEIPQSLYNFLSYPRFTFAGVGIKDALGRLEEVYGLLCKNALEAGPSSWCNNDHLKLCLRGYLLSSRVPDCRRGGSVSDAWGTGDSLTFDEITVAVSNAHAAFRVGELLIS